VTCNVHSGSASNEELHAARLSGKRLLALWNTLPMSRSEVEVECALPGEEIRFTVDTPLEGQGFEALVPLENGWSPDGRM
jgi:hypothetical protein